MPAKKKPTQAEKKAQRAKVAQAEEEKKKWESLASAEWHPDEDVRDRALGYELFRGFSFLPVHAYWSNGVCTDPSLIGKMYRQRGGGGELRRHLASFRGGSDAELGRVMYHVLCDEDEYRSEDDDRKEIIVKPPFMYIGRDAVQEIHALSPFVQHASHNSHLRSFKISFIFNEFEDLPLWWDSSDFTSQMQKKEARKRRVREFMAPGYHASFGWVQGYVTAPYDWLREMFGATVYTAEQSEQWVLEAGIVGNCKSQPPKQPSAQSSDKTSDKTSDLTRLRIIINIGTDAIIPENQPWPPHPGKETGSITHDKLDRLKRNVMKERFAVWPIGGHSYQAVEVVHKAVQMYVDYHYGKDGSVGGDGEGTRSEERYKAYMDAVRCWPARPSITSIVDATQMYLDNKKEYQIKFKMPANKDVGGGPGNPRDMALAAELVASECSIQ